MKIKLFGKDVDQFVNVNMHYITDSVMHILFNTKDKWIGLQEACSTKFQLEHNHQTPPHICFKALSINDDTEEYIYDLEIILIPEDEKELAFTKYTSCFELQNKDQPQFILVSNKFKLTQENKINIQS